MSDKLLNELLNDAEGELIKQEEGLRTEDEKIYPLLVEINMIADPNVHSFVRSVLVKAPDSFWHIPSDFTGENPPDELGLGGNVLHTQRVARIVKLMTEAECRDELETDLLIAAALLHDVTKGLEWGDIIGYDPMHAYTMDDFIKSCVEEDVQHIDDNTRSSTLGLDDVSISRILRLIRCHLGFWSPIPETFPIATPDWILHWANYIASRLHWIVDGDEYYQFRWLLGEENEESESVEEIIPTEERGIDS